MSVTHKPEKEWLVSGSWPLVRKMRILMLGWELPPHHTGGLGVACYNIAKELALEGSSIDFVVPYKAPHPGSEFMTVHCATDLLPGSRFGLGVYDTPTFSTRPSKGVDADTNDINGVRDRYCKYVEKLAAKLHPDVIHAHDWLTMDAGICAKEITNAPLVVHVHATQFDQAGGKSGDPLIHEIEYNAMMMADRIVAVSQVTKNIIIDKYQIPADKIEVIHNSIDISSFNDSHKYDIETYKYLESLKSEGYTIILYLGRLTIQKGLTHLIKALARASEKYDKLVLLLAGEGEQRDDLIKVAAELGVSDKVFFANCFVHGKQVRDAYMVSDIFVMSSVSEPFGLTALEAAHYGNALIISKQSGVGEVLDSVLRYDFWDTDLLANQLVGIATSDALKKSLQQDVKTEYNRLSWHDVALSCLKMYKSLDGVTAS